MITISLCMIVKNEERVLARCLDSVAEAVDEIIIVDTGSTDRTKEIAAKYTNRIYDFIWVDDFSAARNAAYEEATMDYQMWLDADDVLPDEERDKLLKLKESLSDGVDMVTMKYHVHFDAQGKPLMTSTRERLTRRERRYRWQEPVHECIPLQGNIHHADIAIWHRKEKQEGVSTRNLDIYEALEQRALGLSPRQQYYFARELKDHGRYAKAAYYFQAFLDGEQGWVEDNIAACFNLAICYRALKNEERRLSTLLRSFQYDTPRAEVCCEIGYYYQHRRDYALALRWFSLALELKKPDSLGFLLHEYWGFIPSIESCVCACKLEDYTLAQAYNRMAAEFQPDHPAVLQNEAYLNQREKMEE